MSSFFCEIKSNELRAGSEFGAALARRVAAEYSTADVFQIAERAGVKIIYERWPLVTVGECEPRAAKIRVNLAALDRAREDNLWFSAQMLTRVIITHELGHLFDARLNRHKRRKQAERLEDEALAHGFAASLLQLPFSFEKYERFWRDL